MAEVDALAQLKDIHLPSTVGFWPLAPGWYVVIALVFALLAFIIGWSYKRYLNARAKKHALILLQIYIKEYEKDCNSQLMSARISELLKRVALVYFPRNQVASIHGLEWINFLNTTSRGYDFSHVKSELLDSPFRLNEQVDLYPLIDLTRRWIKQRRGPCSN